MPLAHPETASLPAVSGSSGRLIVQGQPTDEAAAPRTWPGQVFEQAALSYTHAMDQYIAERQAEPPSLTPDTTPGTEPTEATASGPATRASRRTRRKTLRQVDDRLRLERRAEREQCRAVDAVWRQQRAEQRAAQAQHRQLSPAAQRAEQDAWRAQQRRWQAAWDARHAELARRAAARQAWRARREQQRQQWSEFRGVPVAIWVAVLVVVDNCTRQCLGLPLFALGAHVTAEEVVAALRQLLPLELRYLITDGGVHFVAAALQRLAQERGFVRVPLPPHRPCTNGIAERFVLTLKEWLKNTDWHNVDELRVLLARFLAEYNDRPHQGEELAGLSPNEYARRMSIV